MLALGNGMVCRADWRRTGAMGGVTTVRAKRGEIHRLSRGGIINGVSA